MKIKRYKKFQRNIGFFVKNFGFHAPYQVIVEGTFAHAALQHKINIREQLPKCLGAAIKIITTPCSLREAEKIGPVLSGALKILRSFTTHRCGHEDNLNASNCVKSLIGSQNENHYIVATQDGTLRERLRGIPGVPLLYLHGNAPTLEAPSEISQAVAAEATAQKTELSDYQKEVLLTLKQQSFHTNLLPEKKGTVKRKRKGPNPLSCKKPKKNDGKNPTTAHSAEDSAPKKRKRPKVRIPKHVKVMQ